MKYLFILLILLDAQVKGQNPGPVLGAMGSGGAAVSGIWSLQQNPAGIAGLDRPSLAVAYERHFPDEDLNTHTALFVMPTRSGVFGASFDSYGFNLYKEQRTGVFYAKDFGGSLKIAVGVKYHQLNIAHYGSANAYSVEVGFQLKVNDDFTIASHISNPNRSRYTSISSLPLKLSFGASGRLSDRVLMIVDCRKILNDPVDAMTGIEYNIVKWFTLRGGVSANPFKQYAGFGIKYNKIQVDVGVASHPSLGYSPQIALGYEF